MDDIGKKNLKKCDAHGLMYDPSKAIGCVLCQKNSKAPSLVAIPPGTAMPEGKKTIIWLLIAVALLAFLLIFRKSLGDDVVTLVGCGGVLVGIIGVIVTAFRMSAMWGALTFFFFIPASIIFAILHRGSAVRYLIIFVAGFTALLASAEDSRIGKSDIDKEQPAEIPDQAE